MNDTCSICGTVRKEEMSEIEIKEVRDTVCFNCLLWHCLLVHQRECRDNNISDAVIWDVTRQLYSILGCMILMQKEGAA